ncbi:putative zinc metalloprotease [Flavobacteriaceae bacterium UJ101]|nr:putative zinc metalloprotease [Flavobacteriaceae bacterium UJ101]
MDSGVLIQIAQLVLCLSILVVLHELGHFLPAKWFKTKVEKFYLFFDPYFSLVKKKIGETEYGIGWLPLGGYVKIAGMVDESMDTEQMKKDPEPWEFRSKPAWQRLIIMAGGIIVNVILGGFIFAGILFTWGVSYLPNENVENGIVTDSLTQAIGFQTGDKVLSIDGEKIVKFNDINRLILEGAEDVEVDRNGQIVHIPIKDEDAVPLMDFQQANGSLFVPRGPVKVGFVAEDTAASKGGLQVDDQVTKVNNQEVVFFDEFQKLIKANKGKTLNVEVLREGKPQNLVINVPDSINPKIGVAPSQSYLKDKVARVEYGFLESIPAGFKEAFTSLGTQVKVLGGIFTRDAKIAKNMGSFFSITKQFDKTWDWHRFWILTGTLSMFLAFINLLPIPALDGGHIVFTLYEMITGKKPSQKFLETAQIIGGIFLMTLMAVVIGWDVIKNFFL